MLTADDLAKRFRVSKRTIYEWHRRGALPRPLKVVGVLRWRVSDLEAWERRAVGMGQ